MTEGMDYLLMQIIDLQAQIMHIELDMRLAMVAIIFGAAMIMIGLLASMGEYESDWDIMKIASLLFILGIAVTIFGGIIYFLRSLDLGVLEHEYETAKRAYIYLHGSLPWPLGL